MIKQDKIKSGIPLILISMATAFAFFRLKAVTEAVRTALSVCVRSLVPSLFPFMIFTELLLSTKEGRACFQKLAQPFSFCLGCSAEGGVAYIIGILFGFPLGIKTLLESYNAGRITKKEAELLFLFCNNTGPAFLIGGIGIGMLGSPAAGVFLYVLEIAVSLFFGMTLRKRIQKACHIRQKISTEEKERVKSSFSSIMQKSVLNMLSICGYVTFFSVIAALVAPCLPSERFKVLIYAFTEIGSAAAFITQSLAQTAFLLPTLAFAVNFSGVSVFLQALDFCQDTKLSIRYYLPAKLLQGALSFSVSFLLLSVFR